MGVTNIIARGYLDPKYAPHHSHTLLQNDVGVGRTLQFLMVITLSPCSTISGRLVDPPPRIVSPLCFLEETLVHWQENVPSR
jgi:hypothetical protein